jgi:uncharacterized protein (TIGR03000 family)
MMAAPPAVAPAPKPKDMPVPPKPAGEKKEVSMAAPATIIVTLPADAKLLVDGNATTSTSTVRRFTTPELAPGREFHYQLKAEAQRDGLTLMSTKEITVRAGEETRVEMQLPISVVQK